MSSATANSIIEEIAATIEIPDSATKRRRSVIKTWAVGLDALNRTALNSIRTFMRRVHFVSAPSYVCWTRISHTTSI